MKKGITTHILQCPTCHQILIRKNSSDRVSCICGKLFFDDNHSVVEYNSIFNDCGHTLIQHHLHDTIESQNVNLSIEDYYILERQKWIDYCKNNISENGRNITVDISYKIKRIYDYLKETYNNEKYLFVGDIHNRWEYLEAVYMFSQETHIQVILLGDYLDRYSLGSSSGKTIECLQKLSQMNTIFCLGNHDGFLLRILYDIYHDRITDDTLMYYKIWTLHTNGGSDTLNTLNIPIVTLCNNGWKEFCDYYPKTLQDLENNTIDYTSIYKQELINIGKSKELQEYYTIMMSKGIIYGVTDNCLYTHGGLDYHNNKGFNIELYNKLQNFQTLTDKEKIDIIAGYIKKGKGVYKIQYFDCIWYLGRKYNTVSQKKLQQSLQTQLGKSIIVVGHDNMITTNKYIIGLDNTSQYMSLFLNNQEEIKSIFYFNN